MPQDLETSPPTDSRPATPEPTDVAPAVDPVEIELRCVLVDFDKTRRAAVSCRTTSAGNDSPSQTFDLNRDSPAAIWVVRDPEWDGWYEVKVDWLTWDGELIEGDWQSSNATRLAINSPAIDTLDVAVICAGNFEGGPDAIAQVAVNLRYSDPAHRYTRERQMIFTGAQQFHGWQILLRDRERREFEYTYSILYRNDVVKNFPEDGTWLPGQRSSIVVGDKYAFKVDIYPTLLAFPDQASVVEVHLSYQDEANAILEKGTFIFNADQSNPAVWRVRGAEAGEGPRSYTYEAIYRGVDGSVTKLAPKVMDQSAIVIAPLEPAMPVTS